MRKVCPFSNDFKFNLEGGGGKDGRMFDWYIDDAIVMASKKNVSKSHPLITGLPHPFNYMYSC